MEGRLHQGVYTMLGGPNYETVAELKMLQMCGVDAVGKGLSIFLLVLVKSEEYKYPIFSLNINRTIVSFQVQKTFSYLSIVNQATCRPLAASKMLSGH